LLVLGDSAAAGVGASSLQASLAGQLAARLSENYRVEWRLVAKTGATTASTLRHLQTQPLGPFDVCITSLGVNDVTSGLGTRAWLAQQATLRQKLRENQGVRRLIISGLPPVHGFPALPQPLRWWLGARATEFDVQLQRQLSDEADARFLSLRFTQDYSLMASDGFHPGDAVYREWAIRAAALIEESGDHSAGRPIE